jgi:hypothetical protein
MSNEETTWKIKRRWEINNEIDLNEVAYEDMNWINF